MDARQTEINRLVVDALPFVTKLAHLIHHRLPSSVDLDDLIQLGAIGAMDAARDFDAARGVKFTTFASRRIRGEIMDGLRRGDYLSRWMRRLSTEGRRRSPRVISFQALIELDRARNQTPDSQAGRGSVENELPPNPHGLEGIRRVDARDEIETRLCSPLTDARMQQCMRLRGTGMTMKQIGLNVGVCESRMSQLLAEAVALASGERPSSKLHIMRITCDESPGTLFSLRSAARFAGATTARIRQVLKDGGRAAGKTFRRVA